MGGSTAANGDICQWHISQWLDGASEGLSVPPARLDGVGGGVFTGRIEHIFEQRLIQVMLEV
jgi:hypothetical protein